MQACRVAHLSKFTMCNSSRPRKNQSTALLIGVILVIFAAVFHTNSSDVVGAICFISFIVTLVAFFIGVTYAVGRQLANRIQKRFPAFICHHKANGGALARWLQFTMPAGSLLASDLGAELDPVLIALQCSVKVVVAYLNQRTLANSWCVAELATALTNGTKVVVLRGCDFWFLNVEEIGMMKQLLGAQRLSLAEHGIDIKIAQRAVDSVQLLDAIEVPYVVIVVVIAIVIATAIAIL